MAKKEKDKKAVSSDRMLPGGIFTPPSIPPHIKAEADKFLREVSKATATGDIRQVEALCEKLKDSAVVRGLANAGSLAARLSQKLLGGDVPDRLDDVIVRAFLNASRFEQLTAIEMGLTAAVSYATATMRMDGNVNMDEPLFLTCPECDSKKLRVVRTFTLGDAGDGIFMKRDGSYTTVSFSPPNCGQYHPVLGVILACDKGHRFEASMGEHCDGEFSVQCGECDQEEIRLMEMDG